MRLAAKRRRPDNRPARKVHWDLRCFQAWRSALAAFAEFVGPSSFRPDSPGLGAPSVGAGTARMGSFFSASAGLAASPAGGVPLVFSAADGVPSFFGSPAGVPSVFFSVAGVPPLTCGLLAFVRLAGGAAGGAEGAGGNGALR